MWATRGGEVGYRWCGGGFLLSSSTTSTTRVGAGVVSHNLRALDRDGGPSPTYPSSFARHRGGLREESIWTRVILWPFTWCPGRKEKVRDTLYRLVDVNNGPEYTIMGDPPPLVAHVDKRLRKDCRRRLEVTFSKYFIPLWLGIRTHL